MPNCTPDCLIPVTEPWVAALTRSAMRAFVAGLPQPWGMPATAAEMASSHQLPASAIRAMPSPLMASRARMACLAPIRSVTRPMVGAVRAPTRVFSDPRKPSAVRLMPRSSMMSTARTEMAKIW